MARRPRLADATLLTDLIGRAVYAEGRRIGRVRDLAARPVPAGPWPIVSLRLTGRAQTVVPAARIRGVQDDRVELAAGTAAPAPHGAVWLRDGVLDREVVDGVGRRIVRVGDVVIEIGGHGLAAAAVDLGAAAVVRRLGLRRLAARLRQDLEPIGRLHVPVDLTAPLTIAAARGDLAATEVHNLTALLRRRRTHHRHHRRWSIRRAP
jgi:sporulation protein YlmC with PRC-barrel domain